MERDHDVAVRRRADGIPQIIPARARRRSGREPYVWTLALLLGAVALYATALVSAAFVLLLGAACTVFEIHHARRRRGTRGEGEAAVCALSRTGTRH
ncbi:MAG: hypothetical protein ACJ79L_19565 [Anaeromyxobacteraceae bacterium]